MPRILRRLPLSLRLPLLGAAMMVLVGVVASQQVLSALGRVQDARLRELAAMHVEGLSVALGPLVLRRDIWEVYDTLERASSESEGRRMILTAVADDAGRVLAATDPRRVPVDSAIDRVAEAAVRLGELSVGASESTVRLIAPLDYQGRTVGRIVTELDVSDLQRERWRALWLLLVGNTLATAILAGLGYIAMRQMLRPVSTMAQQMAGAEGEPQPIAERDVPPGDGEFARLARTYNSMVHDVAAKSQIERRLAERERFVALGRLSSSLAHEINNPLGGLLNATDTIRKFSDRPEVVEKSAELLERGLRHLRDVARVTLDQNRLEPDGSLLSVDDFEDVRLLILPELKRMEQRIDWCAPENLIASPELPAAPARQIMLNLLLNASAATGPEGSIMFRTQMTENVFEIAISNSGPPMSDAAQARLLSDVALAPGGGVGLRLVRDLVQELGGRIELARADGLTTVHVFLPARNGDADA
ncbi:HAMP domain-containing sensor histidine kinase [uncultured Roseovarius sp.]|uniref:sensor histidine kinase n=1 Tax=uncultured Roseovarius sp. TaxID=293344 RepID=UPI00262920CF|nr:HAMP domain-containing sensor histidine kinase [uncultured Roseovarius sp.]